MCNGQTGYTAKKLDSIVNKIIVKLFEKTKSMPKEYVIQTHLSAYEQEWQMRLRKVTEELEGYDRTLEDLNKEIRGESVFSRERLETLIQETEKSRDECRTRQNHIRQEIENNNAEAEKAAQKYDELLTWANVWGSSTMEAKKMIVSNLIDRISVSKGYEIEIDFNISFEQFTKGILNE